MKSIIIIEDDRSIISKFQLQLKKYENIEYFIFENYGDFVDFLDKVEINEYPMVISDHNFPAFKGDRIEEQGQDVFFELFCKQYQGTFIHFSSSPCPEKYTLKEEEACNIKFISLDKKKPESWVEVMTMIDSLNIKA